MRFGELGNNYQLLISTKWNLISFRLRKRLLTQLLTIRQIVGRFAEVLLCFGANQNKWKPKWEVRPTCKINLANLSETFSALLNWNSNFRTQTKLVQLISLANLGANRFPFVWPDTVAGLCIVWRFFALTCEALNQEFPDLFALLISCSCAELFVPDCCFCWASSFGEYSDRLLSANR